MSFKLLDIMVALMNSQCNEERLLVGRWRESLQHQSMEGGGGEGAW